MSDVAPSVFVVDGNDAFRRSLVGHIQALGHPVRAFASAARFHRAYRREWPGCLVLDVCLPGQSGLALYEQLLSEGKRLPAIFLSETGDVSTAVAVMKGGAFDVLEKPVDHRTLLARIREALELDAQWRRCDLSFEQLDRRLARLNARERETLELLLAGESNKRMAAKLLLSQRAVEMRRARLMKKLGTHSLAELFELVLTHRVLSQSRQAQMPWH